MDPFDTVGDGKSPLLHVPAALDLRGSGGFLLALRIISTWSRSMLERIFPLGCTWAPGGIFQVHSRQRLPGPDKKEFFNVQIQTELAGNLVGVEIVAVSLGIETNIVQHRNKILGEQFLDNIRADFFHLPGPLKIDTVADSQ